MTIAAAIPIKRYDGNDAATNFPFTQIFYEDDDLQVIRTDPGGNDITLIETTDYDVNGVGTAAGSIDFPASGSSYGTLATGYQITILRVTDKDRDTDLSGVFKFATVNMDGDRVVAMVQENAEAISRCSKYKASNSATPPDLEDFEATPSPDITKVIQFRVFKSDESVTVGDGTAGAIVDAEFDGWSITSVSAGNYIKGVATGAETLDIQIRKKRLSDDVEVDVLTTKVTIGDERYAADGSVDTANNTINTGDLLFVDRDTVHLTTAPLGLGANVTIQAP